jgi:hypothetical protein
MRNFLRLRLYGYNDHDNLDHGYIMIGYLDIDIKNIVYSNSRTPVNSVRVVISIHDTPAVTAGGKRGETGRHQSIMILRYDIAGKKTILPCIPILKTLGTTSPLLRMV